MFFLETKGGKLLAASAGDPVLERNRPHETDRLEDLPAPVLPLQDHPTVGVVGTGDALDGLDQIDASWQGLKENVAGPRVVNIGTLFGCLALRGREGKTDRRREA